MVLEVEQPPAAVFNYRAALIYTLQSLSVGLMRYCRLWRMDVRLRQRKVCVGPNLRWRSWIC